MSFTQKYTIISPTGQVIEGQVFESTNWPLHTTIADTFAVDAIDEELISQIGRRVKGRNLTVAGKESAYFGKNADIEVMLLLDSPELYSLHSDLADLLLERGAIFNDSQYTKGGFIGHVAQQETKRLAVNERVHLDAVAIIDMFPKGNPYKRRVMKVINF